MSKAKFQAARELIAEGRYEEAKEILSHIDHPTARIWIAKLDERIQQRIEVQQLKVQATRKAQLKKSLTAGNILLSLLCWAFALMLLAGSCLFISAFANSFLPSQREIAATYGEWNRIIQIVCAVVFLIFAAWTFEEGWKRIRGDRSREL